MWILWRALFEMVRFSDIKRIKSKSVSREDLVRRKAEEDRLWVGEPPVQEAGQTDEVSLSDQENCFIRS